MTEISPFLVVDGFCPVCRAPARFSASSSWLRDTFQCETCHTIPRQRALFRVIETCFPSWQSLAVHEFSPLWPGISSLIRTECPRYTWSYFDPGVDLGTVDPAQGWTNENLERLTFPPRSFDLVISQDVFEHVMDPQAAAAEIARVLRPGGAHICTVPIALKDQSSRRRASYREGTVVHHDEPQYHGNPIDTSGSLVTVDWGYDIAGILDRASGLHTTIFHIDDIGQGIRAEANEILVMRKFADIPIPLSLV